MYTQIYYIFYLVQVTVDYSNLVIIPQIYITHILKKKKRKENREENGEQLYTVYFIHNMYTYMGQKKKILFFFTILDVHTRT